jgi:hypothetical protein
LGLVVNPVSVGVVKPVAFAVIGFDFFSLEAEALGLVSADLDGILIVMVSVPGMILMWIDLFAREHSGNEHAAELMRSNALA